VELLEQAKSLAPEDATVASALGARFMTMGKPQEALREFGRALALSPGDALAFNNRGVALLALSQRRAAREDFERALVIEPCLFNARFNLLQLGQRTTAPVDCRYTEQQRRALGELP
jgi:tetratricopeptide (TPR) repeat protein